MRHFYFRLILGIVFVCCMIYSFVTMNIPFALLYLFLGGVFLFSAYIDHACSKQTTEDIEGHLQSCESCKKLYEEMRSDLCSALQMPEFDSRKIFRHAKKSVLAIILALAAVISCFVINAGGAWMGGPAEVGNFITTIFYIAFWSVFSVASRKYVPLNKTSFIISLLTFISAFVGLGASLLDRGGFIAALLTTFSSIPFYGLRLFFDWTELYAVATVLSLGWHIYARYMKCKLENTFSPDAKG